MSNSLVFAVILLSVIISGCVNAVETVTTTTDARICPAVCVPMWNFDTVANKCVFNDCGSGCGPDNETTFLTQDACMSKTTQ